VYIWKRWIAGCIHLLENGLSRELQVAHVKQISAAIRLQFIPDADDEIGLFIGNTNVPICECQNVLYELVPLPLPNSAIKVVESVPTFKVHLQPL